MDHDVKAGPIHVEPFNLSLPWGPRWCRCQRYTVRDAPALLTACVTSSQGSSFPQRRSRRAAARTMCRRWRWSRWATWPSAPQIATRCGALHLFHAISTAFLQARQHIETNSMNVSNCQRPAFTFHGCTIRCIAFRRAEPRLRPLLVRFASEGAVPQRVRHAAVRALAVLGALLC